MCELLLFPANRFMRTIGCKGAINLQEYLQEYTGLFSPLSLLDPVGVINGSYITIQANPLLVRASQIYMYITGTFMCIYIYTCIYMYMYI